MLPGTMFLMLRTFDDAETARANVRLAELCDFFDSAAVVCGTYLERVWEAVGVLQERGEAGCSMLGVLAFFVASDEPTIAVAALLRETLEKLGRKTIDDAVGRLRFARKTRMFVEQNAVFFASDHASLCAHSRSAWWREKERAAEVHLHVAVAKTQGDTLALRVITCERLDVLRAWASNSGGGGEEGESEAEADDDDATFEKALVEDATRHLVNGLAERDSGAAAHAARALGLRFPTDTLARWERLSKRIEARMRHAAEGVDEHPLVQVAAENKLGIIAALFEEEAGQQPRLPELLLP
jgi:hypothetical protein